MLSSHPRRRHGAVPESSGRFEPILVDGSAGVVGAVRLAAILRDRWLPLRAIAYFRMTAYRLGEGR